MTARAMLIDDWMPEWDVNEVHAMRIAAPRERAWAALRATDFARPPLVRALFLLRGLPMLFSRERPRSVRATFDDFVRAGFVILAEAPNEELVLGLAGRFWTPAGRIVRLTPDEFRAFDAPGLALAAWNFRLEDDGGGARLSTETRVRCTDARSRRSFGRYWRLVGPFSGVIRGSILRAIRRTAQSA